MMGQIILEVIGGMFFLLGLGAIIAGSVFSYGGCVNAVLHYKIG